VHQCNYGERGLLDYEGWRTQASLWLDLEEEDDCQIYHINVVMQEDSSSEEYKKKKERTIFVRRKKASNTMLGPRKLYRDQKGRKESTATEEQRKIVVREHLFSARAITKCARKG
jgi:hypothetical protein